MNARLALVLMQKDEGELLKAWIDHHLGITSPDLIHIFDNGSTCQKTRKILKDADQNGIHVSLAFNRRADFERKGEIICKTIQSIQANNSSNFVIPLDCDEFLGIQSGDDEEAKFDRFSIHQHLSKLLEREGYFKVKRHYFNHPHEPDLYHINNTPGKYFFGCSSLESLDVGFHNPRLTNQSIQTKCLESNLIAFHYHNKIFSIRRANAINKMRSRVNSLVDDELKKYVGPGMHLIGDLRGIDSPFAPPKKYRTRAFLDHLQSSDIAFPYDLFQEESASARLRPIKAERSLRQELSRIRRSVLSQLNHSNTTQSTGFLVRLQTANADIKQHYRTNDASLQLLKRAIKRHRPAAECVRKSETISITIRNHRSLANAYLATFIANRNQSIIFDCRNFWTNLDFQLLTLTSSAVDATENRVILRHEATSNARLRKKLMLHFLMLASHQSGLKNKGK